MSTSDPKKSRSGRGPGKRRTSKGSYSSFRDVIKALDELSSTLPDSRNVAHPAIRYEMRDAVLSATSVFYFQHPSFLSFQRENQEKFGQNNASTIFGIHQIPTDPQIRNMLDPVPPTAFFPLISRIGESLFMQGHLDHYRTSIGFLIACDGLQTVSSDAIDCPSCLTKRKSKDSQEVTYSHAAVTPVLVCPGEARVIALPPEFITPQDGRDKQDCEINASLRWTASFLSSYRFWGRVTVMGDDLYSHERFCRDILEKDCDFLLVCKEASHKILYEYLKGATTTVVKKIEKGQKKKKKLTYTYRFVNGVPINGGENALWVNWLELTVTEEGKENPVFFNTWATSHRVTKENVADLAVFGRSRWKVENENNNTLKTKGYNLEHNFGHGEQFLSNTLATINILSFLLHTAQEFWDPVYKTARSLLPRQVLFQYMRTLTTFIIFESFEQLLEVILSKGERKYDLVPHSDTS